MGDSTCKKCDGTGWRDVKSGVALRRQECKLTETGVTRITIQNLFCKICGGNGGYKVGNIVTIDPSAWENIKAIEVAPDDREKYEFTLTQYHEPVKLGAETISESGKWQATGEDPVGHCKGDKLKKKTKCNNPRRKYGKTNICESCNSK